MWWEIQEEPEIARRRLLAGQCKSWRQRVPAGSQERVEANGMTTKCQDVGSTEGPLKLWARLTKRLLSTYLVLPEAVNHWVCDLETLVAEL